jgi:hypothetical protein
LKWRAVKSGGLRGLQHAGVDHAHFIHLQAEIHPGGRHDGVLHRRAEVRDLGAAALVYDARRRLRFQEGADALQAGFDLGRHRLLVGHRVAAFGRVVPALVVGIAVRAVGMDGSAEDGQGRQRGKHARGA